MKRLLPPMFALLAFSFAAHADRGTYVTMKYKYSKQQAVKIWVDEALYEAGKGFDCVYKDTTDYHFSLLNKTLKINKKYGERSENVYHLSLILDAKVSYMGAEMGGEVTYMSEPATEIEPGAWVNGFYFFEMK